jgi:hypothetical protein
MPIEARFAEGASVVAFETLALGEIFLLPHKGGLLVCMNATTDQTVSGDRVTLLLGALDVAYPDPLPVYVVHGALSAPHVIRLQSLRLEPHHGDTLSIPSEDTSSGTITLDGTGTGWLCVAPEGESSLFFNLSVGTSMRSKPQVRVSFSSWILSIPDGDKRRVILTHRPIPKLQD